MKGAVILIGNSTCRCGPAVQSVSGFHSLLCCDSPCYPSLSPLSCPPESAGHCAGPWCWGGPGRRQDPGPYTQRSSDHGRVGQRQRGRLWGARSRRRHCPARRWLSGSCSHRWPEASAASPPPAHSGVSRGPHGKGFASSLDPTVRIGPPAPRKLFPSAGPVGALLVRSYGCGLGQVPCPHWALVSPSVGWGCRECLAGPFPLSAAAVPPRSCCHLKLSLD